ncbi:probable membrane-associated kinase regulator 6 [Solanum dulcamara]|uniref:probable membrane-associated kinase regulator 6 n=1 Tax=Solanum dulcamara TaxID=45834 RepID=UPI002485DDDA|nr:probable membrane-associated kinase regulator 6 [Solanum dulcamara]XP_055829107.1 probable membrane-associated kinase regulator 6 [Solanum dulcamara]
MENSEECDESNLSYNWSVNTKFDRMEYEEEAAFIEMDPSLSPSKRFSNVNKHDFINFNFPISDHKEESIMKNNMLLEEPSQVHTSSSRSSGIFQKLLDFLKPLCQKISFGCKSGSSTRVLEGPILMKKWESSEGTSSITPRTSIANYSEDDWRRSCDSEASIYEAVLHCKRTINGDE